MKRNRDNSSFYGIFITTLIHFIPTILLMITWNFGVELAIANTYGVIMSCIAQELYFKNY